MKQLHPFVEILAKAKPKLRRALLQNLDKDIVKAFSELCLNITNSNISMPLCQKKRCCQHCKIIRDLSVKKKNIKQKSRKLVQQGSGFFWCIITNYWKFNWIFTYQKWQQFDRTSSFHWRQLFSQGRALNMRWLIS
ncbi:hypothetical protein QYM36_011488 [Artemia franciscana]|uniref:Uncharacterized protein n=1 Tax=Artemia franciscana TaxID=6661 RepID=A0AA88L4W2_ARTSF|nr:hypothetical protein QYM36_011488 [Artemia franciscana]